MDLVKCFYDEKVYSEPFSGDLPVLPLILHAKQYIYSHLRESFFATLCSVTSAVVYLEVIFYFHNQENSSLLIKNHQFSQVKYVFYSW